jgi:hypothetical protein
MSARDKKCWGVRASYLRNSIVSTSSTCNSCLHRRARSVTRTSEPLGRRAPPSITAPSSGRRCTYFCSPNSTRSFIRLLGSATPPTDRSERQGRENSKVETLQRTSLELHVGALFRCRRHLSNLSNLVQTFFPRSLSHSFIHLSCQSLVRHAATTPDRECSRSCSYRVPLWTIVMIIVFPHVSTRV